MIDTIRQALNRRRSDILEWTKKLIAFPSENRPPGGNEGPAQEFIVDSCRKMGLDVDVFNPLDVQGIQNHPSFLPGREYPQGRNNVAARWKGSGGGRSILLSGHVDVAPFEPDNWKVCRPFEPVEQDGRLYGRGTADMKGGLSAFLWAIQLLMDIDFMPAGDVIFESVVDEEFAGGNGTLSSRLRGHNADLAILGEPTRMEVCPACLGAFLGDIGLTGKAGMPYMGSAIPNPVFGLSGVIELFSEWQNEWRSRNSHPLFRRPGKELNVVLWGLSSKIPGEFTQMGIPLVAGLSWIVWCYPGMSEKEFYRQFRNFWEGHAASDEKVKPFDFEITPTYHYVRPWETGTDDPGVRAVTDAFSDYTGESPAVGGAPFSCDLALYGDVGSMPAVILGPRGDNLHAPDEWALIEDIYTLAGIVAILVTRWCI